MRTMVGLSLSVLMVLGSTAACSSDKVESGNKGGSGAVISGGNGGSGDNGSAGTAGANSVAGTSSSTGGSGTAGSATTSCPGMPVSCVDEATAKACNPENMVETINCKDVLGQAGLISNGCITDATGSGCTIDGGSDTTCWDGANGVAACAQLTDEQFINAYVDCFTDMNEIRPLLTCVAKHVDAEALTVDCAAAEAECAPMGAAGAGGAP